jgi:hypothetical protein
LELDRIVADLKKERDRLSRAIAALLGSAAAAMGGTRGRKPGRKAKLTGPKKRRRGGITKEGRRRLSEIMKKRWAERRKKGLSKLGR